MRDKTKTMKVKVLRLPIYAHNAPSSQLKETIQTITMTVSKVMENKIFTMNGKRMKLNAFPVEWDIIHTGNGRSKYEILEIL